MVKGPIAVGDQLTFADANGYYRNTYGPGGRVVQVDRIVTSRKFGAVATQVHILLDLGGTVAWSPRDVRKRFNRRAS